MKILFWDLDGTLTDSSEGITKCAKLSLDRMGITGYEPGDLLDFIGPPLRATFPKYGVEESKVEDAVAVYRSRYNTIGKFENKPYEGIRELLGKLKEAGFRHYVATSKPETLSKEILDKFEMSQYFEKICGATEDGRIDSKESVIRYLLSQIDCKKDILMIGDTVFDVQGAASHNIPTIGVSWGFGDTEEMMKAGALTIVNSMEQLYDYLINKS